MGRIKHPSHSSILGYSFDRFSPLQRNLLYASSGLLILLIVATLFFSFRSSYTPLFPADDTNATRQTSSIKDYLDRAKLPYTIENQIVMVPEKHAASIRAELAMFGLPKKTTARGYEIFDDNTWIKGDKELDIMEIRALKGQLEQDLTQFDKVRAATVILSLPTERQIELFHAHPKASVILNIDPNTPLTPHEIAAITNHVTGATRGLDPSMVAISDTTGRVYQGIQIKPAPSSFIQSTNTELNPETIDEKIQKILTSIVGPHNFHLTTPANQALADANNRGTYAGIPPSENTNEKQQPLLTLGKPSSLPIAPSFGAASYPYQSGSQVYRVGISINNNNLSKPDMDNLRTIIDSKLNVLSREERVTVKAQVDFIPFTTSSGQASLATYEEQSEWASSIAINLLWGLGAIALGTVLWLALRDPNAKTVAPAKPTQEARKTLGLPDAKSLDQIEQALDRVTDEIKQRHSTHEPEADNLSLYDLLMTRSTTEISDILARQPMRTTALLLLFLPTSRSRQILQYILPEQQEAIFHYLEEFDTLSEPLKTSILLHYKNELGGKLPESPKAVIRAIQTEMTRPHMHS